MAKVVCDCWESVRVIRKQFSDDVLRFVLLLKHATREIVDLGQDGCHAGHTIQDSHPDTLAT